MRERFLILLGFAALTACTYKKTEADVASVDGGAIRARIVKIDKKQIGLGGIGAGHAGGILYPAPETVVECELRIEHPAKLDLPIASYCEDQRVHADEAGMRLGFGAKSGPLAVVYFGSAGRTFALRDKVPAPIDWAKVGSLADQLPGMFAQAIEQEEKDIRSTLSGGRHPANDFGDDVIAELRERIGVAALEKAVASARATHFPVDRHAKKGKAPYLSMWHRAFVALPADAQTRVRAELLADLAKPKPDEALLARAIVENDLADSRHDDVLLARADELRKEHGPLGAHLLGILQRRLLATSPERAAALACRVVGEKNDDAFEGLETAYRILATTKAACPGLGRAIAAVDAWSNDTERVCSKGAWFCPASDSADAIRKVCTKAEYEARAREGLSLPWPALQDELLRGPPELASERTGWILAQAILAPPTAARQKLIERQGYAWRKPPGNAWLTSCDDKDVKPGDLCRRNTGRAPNLCADAAAIDVFDGADLHYDDAKRERWVEKRR